MRRALRSAPRDCPRASAARRGAACEDYFYSRLDLTPSHELGGREEIVETLELMPEPMYRALQDIVGFVVDGEYDELRVASGGRL